IAENQRLVLALLARRLRRAAGSSVALVGAWLLLTGRLRRSAGLTLGRACVRHFDRSGRQRPADLNGVAVPAGVCRVSQAHGSADATTGGHSELRLMSQPRSSCAWRDLGGAAR